MKTNQLVLPKGRPVEFRIKTKDVLHDFWVPQFRLKSDAVPGLTTKIRLTPDRIGQYDVVCAELCGIGHSTMRQTVRVVEPARLPRLDREAQGQRSRRRARRAGGDAAAAGKQLFTETGCNACHTLADAGSDGHGRAQAGRARRRGRQVRQGRRASRPRST